MAVSSQVLTRQQKLEACIDRIRRQEGVPPFCEHANEVITRTLDLDGGSSSALARLVLKDLGLTSQLLRAANSALYNHSGRPILSVPRGITLMGWDALRNLVSAVRYIEHFANGSAGLRELMLMSLLSAVHSREIAVAVGYTRPEEAYICGLFRNLGEVLIACHCPEEYLKIIVTMHAENIPERAACLRVMDFSWDEVGLSVSTGWNMPPPVYMCLRGSGARVGSPADRCLASITDYARDLTHAVYRDGAGIDAVHVPWVVDSQGRRVLVPVRDLEQILDAALQETQATFAALAIPMDRLRLEQQAERARRVLGALPVLDEAGLKALDLAIDGAMRIVRQGDFELTAVITVLLEAVRAAGFDRAVFALLNEERTVIRGRLASGAMVEDVLRRFQFPVDRVGGPIRAALQRRSDVLVDCSRDGRYDRSALVRALAPAAFALFPIVVDGSAVGCFYADRLGAAAGLDAARGVLGRVRDAMGAAILKGRGVRVSGG